MNEDRVAMRLSDISRALELGSDKYKAMDFKLEYYYSTQTGDVILYKYKKGTCTITNRMSFDRRADFLDVVADLLQEIKRIADRK